MKVLFLASRMPDLPNKRDQFRFYNILRDVTEIDGPSLNYRVDEPKDQEHTTTLEVPPVPRA